MKRTYSKEFKVKACELVLKEGIKHKVVAEKMGINHIMLYKWIDDYQTYGEEAFVGKGNLRSEEAELRKLRKENERLKNVTILEMILEIEKSDIGRGETENKKGDFL